MALTPTVLDTPCEPWPGKPNMYGYGKVKRGGKTYTAHRWVWEQAYGPIPDGICVLHRCDNPPCVALDHLWLGTLADNNRDRAAKGRSAHFPYRAQIDFRGERNPCAKLTAAQVAEIRRRALEGQRGIGKELAAEFSVSRSLITHIRKGEAWVA